MATKEQYLEGFEALKKAIDAHGQEAAALHNRGHITNEELAANHVFLTEFLGAAVQGLVDMLRDEGE